MSICLGHRTLALKAFFRVLFSKRMENFVGEAYTVAT